MRSTLLAVLLGVISFPLVFARQQPWENPSTSGNAFVRICSVIDTKSEEETESDVVHGMACVGYVSGVVDGISNEVAYAHAMTDKEPPKPFCVPDGVENGQIIRIVLKYIGNHPDEAHKSTAFLITSALMDAFPCTARTGEKHRPPK